MRPALRRASGPHHLVRGWAAWFDGGFRGAEQARSRTPFPSPAGGGSRRSGASTVWCAGHACACAHHARIRLREGQKCWWRVSTPRACLHRSSVDGKRLTDHALAACRRRALAVHWSASSGVLAFGQKQRKATRIRGTRADWGRC